MHLRSFVAVLMLSVFSVTQNSALAKSTVSMPVAYEDQDGFVRDKMREYLGYLPLLEKVAGCESTGQPDKIKHWENDGSLVKNPKSSAVGSLQILRKLHADWIAELGLNLKNIDDYMKFLKVLYSTQGYRAWESSKSCWGKYAKYFKR